MNKRIVFSVVLALLALSAIATPASASQPYVVSGNMGWAGPPANLTAQQVGINCLIEADLPYWFSGDMAGRADLHWSIVSHGSCSAAPGSTPANLVAKATFLGTVDGKEGSLELLWISKEWPAAPGEMSFYGTIVILSGTRELANLHGVITGSLIQGDPSDTYSGVIHFDP